MYVHVKKVYFVFVAILKSLKHLPNLFCRAGIISIVYNSVLFPASMLYFYCFLPYALHESDTSRLLFVY